MIKLVKVGDEYVSSQHMEYVIDSSEDVSSLPGLQGCDAGSIAQSLDGIKYILSPSGDWEVMSGVSQSGDCTVTSDMITSALGYTPANANDVPDAYDDTQIKEDLTTKLTEPSSGLAVGKYFKVASIDENGHAVLEAVDLPISESNKLGCILTQNGYGFETKTSGALATRVKTQAEYNSSVNGLAIGKGTLENIKTDLVGRALADTSATAYTAEQQAAARARIGLDKEWVLKGTINSADGVTVDLSGCTELYIVSLVYGTGNMNLVGNIPSDIYLISQIGVNGTRNGVSKFSDSVVGIDGIFYRYNNTVDGQPSSNGTCYSYKSGKHIADITYIRLSSSSNLTSCKIEIYAR